MGGLAQSSAGNSDQQQDPRWGDGKPMSAVSQLILDSKALFGEDTINMYFLERGFFPLIFPACKQRYKLVFLLVVNYFRELLSCF